MKDFIRIEDINPNKKVQPTIMLVQWVEWSTPSHNYHQLEINTVYLKEQSVLVLVHMD